MWFSISTPASANACTLTSPREPPKSATNHKKSLSSYFPPYKHTSMTILELIKEYGSTWSRVTLIPNCASASASSAFSAAQSAIPAFLPPKPPLQR